MADPAKGRFFIIALVRKLEKRAGTYEEHD